MKATCDCGKVVEVGKEMHMCETPTETGETLRQGILAPDGLLKASRNPAYNMVIKEMIELHDRKSHDYAAGENPFSNFEFAAKYSGVPVDKVFDVIIGIKIARLMELKSTGKTPQNESVQDSERDTANYLLIKYAWLLS